MSIDFAFPVERPDISGKVHEKIVAPSCDIQEILVGPLYLDELPQVGNMYSPTPGDPNSVNTAGLGRVNYNVSALTLMRARLSLAAENVGLPSNSEVTEVMDSEIETQHFKRCDSNAEGLDRLIEYFIENGVTSVPERIADLLWRYRAGYTTLPEAAELLTLYPVIGSIEVSKITSPFDDEAVRGMYDFTNRELLRVRSCLLSQNVEARVRLYGEANANQRYVTKDFSVQDSNGEYDVSVLVLKATAGEVTVAGKPPLLLKRKVSYIGLPLDRNLVSGEQNVKIYNDKRQNVHVIGGSYYLCVNKADVDMGRKAIDY